MVMSLNTRAINKYDNYYKTLTLSQKLKLKYHQHISKHSKQDLLYNTLPTCLVDVMEKCPDKPLDNIKVMSKGHLFYYLRCKFKGRQDISHTIKTRHFGLYVM